MLIKFSQGWRKPQKTRRRGSLHHYSRDEGIEKGKLRNDENGYFGREIKKRKERKEK